MEKSSKLLRRTLKRLRPRIIFVVFIFLWASFPMTNDSDGVNNAASQKSSAHFDVLVPVLNECTRSPASTSTLYGLVQVPGLADVCVYVLFSRVAWRSHCATHSTADKHIFLCATIESGEKRIDGRRVSRRTEILCFSIFLHTYYIHIVKVKCLSIHSAISVPSLTRSPPCHCRRHRHHFYLTDSRFVRLSCARHDYPTTESLLELAFAQALLYVAENA